VVLPEEVVLLDSYALVGALRGEAITAEVRQLFATSPTAISTVNLSEVMDKLARLAGRSEESVREAVGALKLGGLSVVTVDEEIAWRAGLIRARHYHRRSAPLSLADCTLVATALSREDWIATSDPHIAMLGRELDITIVALPDSEGKRP
jgi:PIN domain nuclease of toxin-antitoxin system